MHLFSSYSCWQLLMNQTRQESRDRAALSDVYSNVITNKLSRISDDLQRIYKRVSLRAVSERCQDAAHHLPSRRSLRSLQSPLPISPYMARDVNIE